MTVLIPLFLISGLLVTLIVLLYEILVVLYELRNELRK